MPGRNEVIDAAFLHRQHTADRNRRTSDDSLSCLVYSWPDAKASSKNMLTPEMKGMLLFRSGHGTPRETRWA